MISRVWVSRTRRERNLIGRLNRTHLELAPSTALIAVGTIVTASDVDVDVHVDVHVDAPERLGQALGRVVLARMASSNDRRSRHYRTSDRPT